MENGINSKDRVKKYGEVFTPDSIVNDMMNLVDDELPSDSEYIIQTFLEPSCGDGQFLVRILYRKLLKIEQLSLENKQLELIKAISSIYGVDIKQDNVIRSRERLLELATGKEVSSFDLNGKINNIKIVLDIDYSEQLIKIIKFILDNNIICGNILQCGGKTVSIGGIGEDIEATVILSEYNFNGETVIVKQFPLFDLDMELKSFEPVNYMNIDKLDLIKTYSNKKNSDNDDIDNFDF